MDLINIRLETAVSSVEPQVWDALDHGPSPFLKHGFLRALEESGSIGPGSGWHPAYLLAELDGELVGAVVAFIKTHSYGEYIFDWAWARASEQAGLPYYPKLVIAAPVTPATGKRILVAPGADVELVTQALVVGVHEVADRAECSSIHWLFASASESERLARLGFDQRVTYQFHWHNQDYQDFDHFLSHFTSRKRKQVRKERRRGLEAIDDLRFVPGKELSAEQIDCMDRYYRNTVHDHWGKDYLNPGFFQLLVDYLPEHVLFADARQGGETIAGALFLETDRALYGRYWGCDQRVDFLHFEVAYYAGIERCIERGLPLFEAGAQGQHKLFRGFMPARTYSNHWIRHPQLAHAIRGFLRAEVAEVEHHISELAKAGPFKAECE
ncbi:MAG: GNAT family N-acetyltransferase [Deltaproteobacteria bacterium]|nr:GNAT family N-acetyltransferase [Deltaproteobacteria bacterium]